MPAGASPKSTVSARAPPTMAVAIPILKPPNAVAKNTAGKYGVNGTSGRISERPHRATVASAMHEAANPALKNGDGCDVPHQPRRNSSVHFTINALQPADSPTQRRA